MRNEIDNWVAMMSASLEARMYCGQCGLKWSDMRGRKMKRPGYEEVEDVRCVSNTLRTGELSELRCQLVARSCDLELLI